MRTLLWIASALWLSVIGLLALPSVAVRGYQVTAVATKPPPATPPLTTTITPPAPKPTPTRTPIYGGEWSDDFWTSVSWSSSQNVAVFYGMVRLKIPEQLDWMQTYTEHFAPGEFFQTEAISNSVRLAPIAGTLDYFTTGMYTSTVFDASRQVDWISVYWVFSGLPYSLTVEYRTGDTVAPDATWSDWTAAMREFYIYCGYSPSLDKTECKSDLSGIASSRYLQYRARFNSGDARRTMALEYLKVFYGLYVASGEVTSTLINPGDLLAWQGIFYTATVPANTHLLVDVLSADGTILIPHAMNETSLAGIDPATHPSIKLRATLLTNDPARSPELDVWGVRWLVGWRGYFPVIGR